MALWINQFTAKWSPNFLLKFNMNLISLLYAVYLEPSEKKISTFWNNLIIFGTVNWGYFNVIQSAKLRHIRTKEVKWNIQALKCFFFFFLRRHPNISTQQVIAQWATFFAQTSSASSSSERPVHSESWREPPMQTQTRGHRETTRTHARKHSEGVLTRAGCLKDVGYSGAEWGHIRALGVGKSPCCWSLQPQWSSAGWWCQQQAMQGHPPPPAPTLMFFNYAIVLVHSIFPRLVEASSPFSTKSFVKASIHRGAHRAH